MRFPSPVRFAGLLVPLAVLFTGCTPEAPYWWTDYRFHQRGLVILCYNDEITTQVQLKEKADEICRQYDRTSQLQLLQEYQCSWTAPGQANFLCIPRPGENPDPILKHLAPMRHDTPLAP
jgi:hypothetical protein